ncbi:MAG TPA: NAD-dependent epimerase/dehydratase family protein [Opitutaceae bacterium]|nr:NAD-dependent epimerase/dehydratase family protein [Opitutaceae bacterium]
MKVLVTGAAGFIGYHVARRLAESRRCEVVGIDNLNDYYSVDLKRARLEALAPLEQFRFVQMDFSDLSRLSALWSHVKPDYVVHLGAQANVRYSVQNPAAYVQSNLVGFFNVLEAARALPPKHLVFASSSSVYGASARTPFREDTSTSRPLSFYGATKKSNEVMAHSYAHLHGLNLTGLRFFNVYGPWGRPDTAPTLFAQRIFAGEAIDLFAEGRYLRDFTYISDIVDGVVKVLLYPPAERPTPPFRLLNLGHHRPVEVRLFVDMLASLIGKPARLNLLPPQPADVPETCADLTEVSKAIGYVPKVALEEGLRAFVDWYRDYYVR